jgi:CheY-like chemotaxis protein
MPNKNGIQATLEIRQFYATKQAQLAGVAVQAPKIVFLTAFTTPQFRKFANDNGVDEVYEKPMQIEELKQLVLSVLDS